MIGIREEISTTYYADIVGTEEYALKDEYMKHFITYDVQGKRMHEAWMDCDWNCDEDVSFGCWGVSYINGLEQCKMHDGFYVGEYTHHQISENSRIVRYDGKDEQWEKEYCDELLVFEEVTELGEGTKWCEYEYDDNGRVVLEKYAFLKGDVFRFCIREYIYQDGKLHKEIWYSSESPSIEDFFNGNHTKNENDITREFGYVQSESQNGDERVVIIKTLDMLNNTLCEKTICTYDTIHNRIVRKIEVFFSSEPMVVETIYEY